MELQNTQELTFTQNDFYVLKVNRYFGLFGDFAFFHSVLFLCVGH